MKIPSIRNFTSGMLPFFFPFRVRSRHITIIITIFIDFYSISIASKVDKTLRLIRSSPPLNSSYKALFQKFHIAISGESKKKKNWNKKTSKSVIKGEKKLLFSAVTYSILFPLAKLTYLSSLCVQVHSDGRGRSDSRVP